MVLVPLLDASLIEVLSWRLPLVGAPLVSLEMVSRASLFIVLSSGH